MEHHSKYTPTGWSASSCTSTLLSVAWWNRYYGSSFLREGEGPGTWKDIASFWLVCFCWMVWETLSLGNIQTYHGNWCYAGECFVLIWNGSLTSYRLAPFKVTDILLKIKNAVGEREFVDVESMENLEPGAWKRIKGQFSKLGVRNDGSLRAGATGRWACNCWKP